MASSKRQAEDDDDESDARSDSHEPQRKKQRPTLEPDGEHLASSSDEAIELDNQVNLAEPVEADFDSDAEDAHDNYDVTHQYILGGIESNKLKDNVAAEYGVIEEILCQNFMCHSKLRIKLGPLINFIIGHNGSGKSAVLAALTLCLGSKAATTNRGSSLKHFIKQGKDHAMLAVKIKNQGDMAHMPDVYGDSIIVERHFNSSGATSFKLKSANGVTISTKRADLEDMLDYLALQLDNPMNVLTQDLARQFLNNSTPRDKYKFFMRGTQLEQLDRDYRMIEEALDSTETKHYSLQDDIEILKKQAEAAEHKKKQIDRTQTIHAKVKKLSNMFIWAQVEDSERSLERKTRAVEAAELKVQKATEVEEERSAEYDRLHQANETAQQKYGEITEGLAAVQERHADVKERFDKHKHDLMENTATKRRIQADLTTAKAEVEKHKRSIQVEQARIEAENGPAQAQRLVNLETAKREKDERFAELSELDNRQLENTRSEAEMHVRSKRNAIASKRDALRAAEGMLSSISNRNSEALAAYHPKMSQLLAAIRNEDRFSTKPIGPMGMHLRLKKPEWSSILETTFGGVLEGFVVTSHGDRTILSQLQQRHGCNTTIYVGSPGAIDISRNEPDSSVDTILRVLEIDNDLVRNQIIINQSAEQTVLIRDRQEAFDFMERQPDRNYNTKFTIGMHDSRRGWGVRYTRGVGSGPVRAFERRPRIQTDREAQIRSQQATVNHLKAEYNDAERSVREAEQELKLSEQALVRFNRQKKERRELLQRAEDRIEDLQNQIEGDRIDAGTLDAYQEQLRDAEEAKQQHEQSYVDALDEKARIDALQREVKAALDSVTAEMQEAEAMAKKAKTRLATTAHAREKALAEKNAAVDEIDQAKQEKADAEKMRERSQEEVDDMIRQASAMHHRIPVEANLTPEMIEARLKKLDLEVKQAEQQIGGNRVEIHEAWERAKSKYRNALKELKDATALSRSMKKTLIVRKYRWKAFRHYITARAKFMFTYLLSERGFRGHILVDHEHQAMDISVEPDMAKASDRGRQTKTLSGGEKSFSTICLLLSIWEAMGSPIRCLDEFDVFMDQVNRDISMKMMIEAARRAVSRQFILITPQAMNNIVPEDDVKIHRLGDPERGQTALPFGS